MHDPRPYTTAMQALHEKYVQPRQLVQSKLGDIFNPPDIKFGDSEAFDLFGLSVQSLVGMLRTWRDRMAMNSDVDLMLIDC